MSNTPLDMVTRAEWGAAPAKHQDPLHRPVSLVSWAWTCSDPCSDRASCGELLRNMQACHMGRKNLADIKYNFLIAPDGTVYEGRGWLSNTSYVDPQNEHLHNSFIMIARIGMDFEDFPKTALELEAFNKIIENGIQNGHVHPEWEDTPTLMWLQNT